MKIFTNIVENGVQKQLEELIKTNTFDEEVIKIMPDTHVGTGCVIGFTAPIKDKIIPNIVGVDLGCGVTVCELGKINITENDLKKLDEVIRTHVPSGLEVRNTNIYPFGFATPFSLIYQLKCKSKLKNISHLEKSLGTLGGGNHFIELDVDKNGNKYLIVHTGSRNLGNQVAKIYQNKAIKQTKDKFKRQREVIIDLYKEYNMERHLENILKEIKSKQIYKDELCALEGEEMEDYLHDAMLCKKFATENRRYICFNIIQSMGWKCLNIWENIHNYIGEDNIVRKGAISARKGEKIIIPINMKDGCIIGYGKGNADWNYSAPHGAGRLMSRKKAKDNISLDEFKGSMNGIYTTCINENTIDESPMAYKNIEDIVNNIKDTVKIEKIIKPIYNFKADK